MNEKTALTELLACVEAGKFPVRYEILVHAAVGAYHPLFWNAYDDDMAAAIELVEHLTPGAALGVSGDRSEGWFAFVSNDGRIHEAHHPTNPARSLLVAGIKARLGAISGGMVGCEGFEPPAYAM